MKCPEVNCPLGLVQQDGIHLAPICPAHGAPGNGARGHEFRIGKFGGNSCVFGDFPRLCGRPESEHSTPPAKGADA